MLRTEDRELPGPPSILENTVEENGHPKRWRGGALLLGRSRMSTVAGIAENLESPTTASTRVLEPSPVHEAAEADEYGEMIRRHAWLLNRPMVNLLSSTGLSRGRVLDIGTGPGWIPVELALRHPHWEIWAVDPSGDMLAQAQQAACRACVSARLHFLRGDAGNLPFETGMFDLVYSHFVLHHLPRPGEMFDEAARVTRGGGRIVIKDLLRQPVWKTVFLSAFSKLVLRYTPAQLKMYRESLNAALTFREIQEALKNSKLSMAGVDHFRGLDFVIKA